MPTNKDLKRLVRARMKKTGEAYTAARAQVIKTAPTADNSPSSPAPSPVAAPGPVEYARLAGMSDGKITEKTGCNWERWVYALDRHHAADMSHREIADLVSGKYKVGDRWTQAVTVGYERIKGLRARGQRRNGTFEAAKSRTFTVPVATLFDAWADPKVRRKWLTERGVKVRTATAPKSMRIGFADGTIIAVGFIAKGTTKSTVAVQHTKLPDRKTADGRKAYWSSSLDALGEILTSRAG